MKRVQTLGGVAAVAIAIVATPAAAVDQTPYRVACNGADLAAAKAAVVEGRRLVTVAESAIPPADPAQRKAFTRWFGGPAGDTDPQVEKIFSGIRASLSFANIWCPNKTLPDEEIGKDTIAWVPGGATGELFLQAPFFSLQTSGADSQAGTIIHEVGHLSPFATVVDSDVDGDSKSDYSIADAEQLARTNKTLARRTANNLQYFTEDLAHGIP